MKKIVLIFFCAMLVMLSGARNGWYMNFSPGVSYVPPMPLDVRQTGYTPISFWANYGSAPLKSPLYYSVRLGFASEKSGWEVEMNHLKVYLKNKPKEIQSFSVSHGYNQVFVSRIKNSGGLEFKTGVGLVFSHPENTVRNMKYDEKPGKFYGGYHISGIAIKYGMAKEFRITRRFFIIAEACLSAAYASVPVVNGRARVPVGAIHLQVGPKYYFIKKQGTN